MATYQRPTVNPVVDAQRTSRWPIFLFLVACIAAIGGGIAYDRYVVNAPIVLTPSRPGEPSTKPRTAQPSSPSPIRPGGDGRPATTTSSAPTIEQALSIIIPAVIVGVFLLIFFTIVRRARRAAQNQVRSAGPVGGGPIGVSPVGTGKPASGPWARPPVAATTTTTRVAQVEPVKRKGIGFPLLPIIVGAIILDQAMFNGRYSREALAYLTTLIESFRR